MENKEILELSAKAVDIEVYESCDESVQRWPILVYSAGGGMGTMPYEEKWNPIVNPAQAILLVAALKLDIEFGQEDVSVSAYHNNEYVGCVQDKHYNLLLAITKAAAEIGRIKNV